MRASSYIYPGAPGITDGQALAFHNDGVEIGVHVNTGCADWTPASLDNDYTTQMAALAAQVPPSAPSSNRTHCIAWSDWATQPEVEKNHGVRLDVNYYYWPPGWVQDRPGMFTGSGMPMRFAKLDGTMIDCYQATSQMTDESGQSYPATINALLDRAIGPEGYFGVFTANMHTDFFPSAGSDAIVASALARDVPVVSGRQMLEWLDGRNGSSFGDMAWNGSVLSFEIAVGGGANRLRAMLPNSATVGQLTGVTRDAILVPLTVRDRQGGGIRLLRRVAGRLRGDLRARRHAARDLRGECYAAPERDGDDQLDDERDLRLPSRLRDLSRLGVECGAGFLVISHSIELTGLATNTTYYYRVTSRDAALNSATFPPDPPDPPAQFTMPALACLDDDLEEDFAAGTTGGATYVSATGDGEVILAPAAGAEFSGSSLPAGWEAVAYGGGGQAVVGGGVVTIDGHRVNTTGGPAFGPGRVIEFVATFNSAVNQHVGFGNTLNEPPWALFSTAGGPPDALRARSWDGGAFNDLTLPGSWLGAPHRYRIEWTASEIRYFIDGALMATHATVIAGPMRPIAADGPADGSSFTVDWMRMTPYPSAGIFLSRVFDSGGSTEWGPATWTSTTPAGTTLAIATRTGNTATPDGTWTAFIALSGSGGDVPGNSRYLQYRAELATSQADQHRSSRTGREL